LNRRFDIAKSAKADLLALKKRLEQQDLGERIRRQERALATNLVVASPSVWTRLRRFLAAMAPFNRTRSRVEALEQEIANLRRAVIDVIETESTSLVQVIKGMNATAATTLEQVTVEFDHFSADIAARYDAWMAEYARKFEQTQDTLRERIGEIEQCGRLERLRFERALLTLEKRLTEAGPPTVSSDRAGKQTKKSPTSPRTSLILDHFHAVYDERYGPAEQELKRRLGCYRPDLHAARQRTRLNGPVIDIRCGRGELLELLQEDGFQVIGIDTNEVRLDEARHRGLPVVRGDAIEYLKVLDQNSVMAVVGIGMAERVPFVELIDLVQEASRILSPGGIIILETPDPRNLVVSASKFHLDPTRLRPIPYEVLHALFEAVGFDEIVQRPVNGTHGEERAAKLGSGRCLRALIEGAENYAIIATWR
jgi:SAM-dependent methyltransferase